MTFAEFWAMYGKEICVVAGSLVLTILNFIYTKVSHKSSQARLDALEKSDLIGLYVECPRCGSKINLSDVTIYKEVLNEKKSIEKKE